MHLEEGILPVAGHFFVALIGSNRVDSRQSQMSVTNLSAGALLFLCFKLWQK